MLNNLFSISPDQMALTLASAAGIFLTVITYTRIAGLRSFAKMSSFDFAMTVAVGSLIASVAVTQVSLVEGMLALAALYALQVVIALLRRFVLFKRVIDNTPMLLIRNGVVLEDNMKKARLTKDDLHTRLRAANILNYKLVRAAVFETTGDISVVTNEAELDPAIFESVIGADKLR